MLSEDGERELFAQVLKGLEYHVVGEAPVEYRCYCSRERVERAISCIDASDMAEMIRSGEDVSVSCQFCDRTYSFSPAQLRDILGKAQKN